MPAAATCGDGNVKVACGEERSFFPRRFFCPHFPAKIGCSGGRHYAAQSYGIRAGQFGTASLPAAGAARQSIESRLKSEAVGPRRESVLREQFFVPFVRPGSQHCFDVLRSRE
jgi:hypothetical protein